MINLNKHTVTKELLLQEIDEVQIFSKYSNKEVLLGEVMLSPLRKENRPSFGYFVGENNEIYFKDFVLGGGDCIKFVQLKYGLSYFEALSKIAIDFKLEDKFLVKQVTNVNDMANDPHHCKGDIIMNSSPILLEKKRRAWQGYDYAYWLQYGITKKVLERYNVEPISYMFINGTPIKVDKFAYCFIEHKDKRETYKIYQPYSKEYKWRSNHNSSIWQGWEQLPDKGEVLFITKSLKDVMSIVNTTDYAAVALQSESIKPKDSVIDELKSRFNNIYVLYDNDFDSEVNWGQVFAVELIHKYNLSNVVINAKHGAKDYSDLIKAKGPQVALEILEEEIKNSLPF